MANNKNTQTRVIGGINTAPSPYTDVNQTLIRSVEVNSSFNAGATLGHILIYPYFTYHTTHGLSCVIYVGYLDFYGVLTDTIV